MSKHYTFLIICLCVASTMQVPVKAAAIENESTVSDLKIHNQKVQSSEKWSCAENFYNRFLNCRIMYRSSTLHILMLIQILQYCLRYR